MVCTAFRALLQIQALEPLDPDLPLDDDEATGNPKVYKVLCLLASDLLCSVDCLSSSLSCQYSTPGFQCVPLLQALNGYQLEDKIDTGPELQQGSQALVCVWACTNISLSYSG